MTMTNVPWVDVRHSPKKIFGTIFSQVLLLSTATILLGNDMQMAECTSTICKLCHRVTQALSDQTFLLQCICDKTDKFGATSPMYQTQKPQSGNHGTAQNAHTSREACAKSTGLMHTFLCASCDHVTENNT